MEWVVVERSMLLEGLRFVLYYSEFKRGIRARAPNSSFTFEKRKWSQTGCLACADIMALFWRIRLRFEVWLDFIFIIFFILTLCRIRLWLPGTPTIKWSHIKSPLETMTDYKGTHPCFNTVLVWGFPKPCFRMDALNVFRTRKASFPSMSAMGDQTVWGWQKLSGCLNRPHLVRTAILRQRWSKTFWGWIV